MNCFPPIIPHFLGKSKGTKQSCAENAPAVNSCTIKFISVISLLGIIIPNGETSVLLRHRFNAMTPFVWKTINQTEPQHLNILLQSRFSISDFTVISNSSTEDVSEIKHSMAPAPFLPNITYKTGNANNSTPVILFILVCRDENVRYL